MEMRVEEGRVCRAERRGASLADIAKRERETALLSGSAPFILVAGSQGPSSTGTVKQNRQRESNYS